MINERIQKYVSWLRRSANAGYDAAYDMLPDLEEE